MCERGRRSGGGRDPAIAAEICWVGVVVCTVEWQRFKQMHCLAWFSSADYELDMHT